METMTELQVKDALVERRRRLTQALERLPDTGRLSALLGEVDAALSRLNAGTFGLCETCHDAIEPDRIAADPLTRYCLDHLTPGEQRALQQDLDLAWRVQAGLLPRPELRAGGWEACYRYEPAGPAGGDCCDLLPLENGDVLFMLGDVMGKGLAASMLMAHLQAIFRSLATVSLPVAELAERANRVFCQSTTGSHYATVVLGRLNASGTVELVNAGHCPPVIVRGGRASTIAPTGLPFGLFTGTPYSSTPVQMGQGDALLLYTDGLTETRNAEGEEYGADRLELLALAHAGRSGRDIVRHCLEGLAVFRGAARREDDQTILVLKRSLGAEA
jgi:sigma-B regulation protein RsbU (phosphoserine phosphatase)